MTTENPFKVETTTATAPEEAAQTAETTGETAESPEAATLQAELEQAKARQAELYDQLVRMTADFENFRKRRQQEQQEQAKYGSLPTLMALLPVLDNLERAKNSLTVETPPESLLKSIEMMQHQLMEALQQLGLQRQQDEGQAFDPNCHEAVGQFASTDVPPGHVMAVQQAGYKLHERPIRAAMVVVASEPETAPVDEPVAETEAATSPVDTQV